MGGNEAAAGHCILLLGCRRTLFDAALVGIAFARRLDAELAVTSVAHQGSSLRLRVGPVAHYRVRHGNDTVLEHLLGRRVSLKEINPFLHRQGRDLW